MVMVSSGAHWSSDPPPLHLDSRGLRLTSSTATFRGKDDQVTISNIPTLRNAAEFVADSLILHFLCMVVWGNL